MDAFDIAAALVACSVLLAMALALFLANHYGRRYRQTTIACPRPDCRIRHTAHR